MKTFLIVLLAVALLLVLLLVIVGLVLFVSHLRSRVWGESVMTKEGVVLFRKNINTRNTYFLGLKGSVRAFNYLFDKKSAKRILKDSAKEALEDNAEISNRGVIK